MSPNSRIYVNAAAYSQTSICGNICEYGRILSFDDMRLYSRLNANTQDLLTSFKTLGILPNS